MTLNNIERLTAEELRVIIKACRSNGVSSFVLGNLRIEFKEQSNIIEPIAFESPISKDEPLPIKQQIEKQQENYENLLAEAKLLDPVLYESLMEREEIGYGREETEDV